MDMAANTAAEQSAHLRQAFRAAWLRVFLALKQNPRLVGDVQFAEAKEVAGYITPVPGGVVPMTIAMLMKNTLRASQIQHP
ncbi:MAG: hypothetical protein HY869_11640 [Chloroflexi bacterium]|nr:hypothetical protein [Chloroflexota bacterium]